MSEVTNSGPNTAILLPQLLKQALETVGNQNAAAAVNTSAQRRREEKIRKKDNRSWENVNKSLSALEDEEKFTNLCDKYKQLYEDFRKVQQDNSHLEASLKVAAFEKANLQGDLQKATEMKETLENLCRELQKKYKDAKDMTIMQLQVEEERRRTLSDQFSARLGEITRLMEEANKKSEEMRNENALMQARVTELTTQFLDRDKGISEMVSEMDTQRQLSDVKLQQMKLEIDEERHIFETERLKLQAKLQHSEQSAKVLHENNQNLQSHVDVYKNQYHNFEDTMNKTSKMFEGFKDEITKVNKKNAYLEDEMYNWQVRVRDCTMRIIEETEKNNQKTRELNECRRSTELLKRLSRRLQEERQQYLQLLKNHNIPIVEVPITDSDLGATAAFDIVLPTNLDLDIIAKQPNLDNLKKELTELQYLTDLSRVAHANRVNSELRFFNPSAFLKAAADKKAKPEPKKNTDENVEVIEEEDSTANDMPSSTGAIKKKRNRNRRTRKQPESAPPAQMIIDDQVDASGKIITSVATEQSDEFEEREPLESILASPLPNSDMDDQTAMQINKLLGIDNMFQQFSFLDKPDNFPVAKSPENRQTPEGADPVADKDGAAADANVGEVAGAASKRKSTKPKKLKF